MSEHPGFFGGGTVRDGLVRRLPSTDFANLVQTTINVPVRFAMTRKEFLAHPEKNSLKDSSWLSPCA